jgi:hypothetical protein
MRELKQDWRDVFRAFRLGLDIWKIGLAFAGVVVSVGALWLLAQLQEVGNGLPIAIAALACWVLLLVSMLRSEDGLDVKKMGALAVVLVLLGGLVLIFLHLSEGVVLGLGTVVVLTLVWALFGGAIARSAVVELATDERIGMGEALKYAAGHYRHYVWSILAPMVGIALFLCIMALGGFVARVPVLNILVALFTTPLYLLAGFIVMLMLIGLVVGCPLMFPAISAEGSDSFDAISRAYSYIYTKPWRYLWYELAGKAYGIACAAFIVLFTAGVLISADRALRFGMGKPYKETVGPGIQRVVDKLLPPIHVPKGLAGGRLAAERENEGSYLLRKFRHAFPLVTAPEVTLKGTRAMTAVVAAVFTLLFLIGALATIISMWLSRQSIIYLLMRKAVDGTDMTEVFQEEKEEDDYLVKAAGGKAEATEEAGEAKEEGQPEAGTEPSAEGSAEEGGTEKGPEGESPRRPRRRPTRGKEGESE